MHSHDPLAQILEKLRLHPNLIRHILQELNDKGQVDLVITHLPLGEYELHAQNDQTLAITIIFKKQSP